MRDIFDEILERDLSPEFETRRINSAIQHFKEKFSLKVGIPPMQWKYVSEYNGNHWYKADTFFYRYDAIIYEYEGLRMNLGRCNKFLGFLRDILYSNKFTYWIAAYRNRKTNWVVLNPYQHLVNNLLI